MLNQKQKVIILFGALAALIVLFTAYKIKEVLVPWTDDDQPVAETPKKLEDLSIEHLIANKASADTATAVAEQHTALGSAAEAFKKCFKKDWPQGGMSAVFKIVENYRDFSSPMLIEENYELQSSQGEKIVVQYIPAEENTEQVRAFKINPTDQLPDRIKDFPQASAKAQEKLAGALTLGQLQKKTTSTNQTAYDGALLSVDKENDKVTRFHVVSRDFDFECKYEKCVCLTK